VEYVSVTVRVQYVPSMFQRYPAAFLDVLALHLIWDGLLVHA
jgi:hypothetical protein